MSFATSDAIHPLSSHTHQLSQYDVDGPGKFIKSSTVGVIGCPFSGGQPKAGVDTGPHHLIEFGLLDQIKELGYNVSFGGHQQFAEIMTMANLEDPDVGKLKRPRYVGSVTRALSAAVEERCRKGELALTVGGDHSLAIGTVSGVFAAYPDACLIWIDAHADINTPETTISGNIHGMPVSFLLGIAGNNLPESLAWIPHSLRPDRIAYIGLRDVDPEEKKILREHNIAAFSMYHVDKYGIGKVVEMALDRINPKRDRPIHLSFDVDALDPTFAPSTGTPVRGGLTYREGCYICESLHETGCLVAVDMMEVNPTLERDLALETVRVATALVRCALGETLL